MPNCGIVLGWYICRTSIDGEFTETPGCSRTVNGRAGYARPFDADQPMDNGQMGLIDADSSL